MKFVDTSPKDCLLKLLCLYYFTAVLIVLKKLLLGGIKYCCYRSNFLEKKHV